MDPAGPWSAYAYNRLAQSAEHPPGAPPPTTSSQILPSGFIPTSYDFNLFHAAAANSKQPSTAYRKPNEPTEYQYFDQATAPWQQTSPFGILPHETTKNTAYEHLNAHFTLNSQISKHTKPAPAKAPLTPAAAPQFTPHNVQAQQSCIVSKEYRVPARGPYPATPPRAAKQPSPVPQIQTKAQTKIYPDLVSQVERTRAPDPAQSSPISFSIEPRLNYPAQADKRPFAQAQPNYRHYPNSGEQEFRPNPDCVVVPRRPSPLAAHAQVSPLGPAPSPSYPMYSSPQSQATPPLDVSVPRPAYPSVITRTLPNSQNCWDERNKRFGGQFEANSQRTAQYFDGGNQVNLQDLSSCRGDPMSIVKNLQEQEVKVPVKRRKSTSGGEKGGGGGGGGEPPPAHNQNGVGYFDFDRWNLPSPNKVFPHQVGHQPLMVPHPHAPPPPLPYFPSFHLASQANFQGGGGGGSEQVGYNQMPQGGQFAQPPVVDEHPKVVVPNIEEELNFLAQGVPAGTGPKVAKTEKANGAGFMSSYLKFLQGDRGASPPPSSSRGNRKNWTNNNRAKPQILSDEKIHSPESQGLEYGPSRALESTQVNNGKRPPPVQPLKRLSKGDPQDDPRYFPLPKERKRNSFDSDDDGDFFDESRGANKGSKTSCAASGRSRKRSAVKKVEEVLVRREPVKRAAKEKRQNFQQLGGGGGDEIEEPQEFVDSDSDPAWTPQAKNDDEEIVAPKKGRKSNNFKRKRNLISAAAQGAGIKENDSYNDGLGKKKIKMKQNNAPTLEDNIAASLNNRDGSASSFFTLNNAENDSYFKSGQFVVIKADLGQGWPAIWKVDGKTLLQKFEPFEENGVTFYKNISTYTSYTQETKKQYVLIPTRLKSHNQLETIVEFLRDEMTLIDQEYQQKCLKESDHFQDHFEVYIQTLISQALDSNFLTEIFQEKDEYFLSNVKTIDDITDSKKRKLHGVLKWPATVQAAICTWPCFNVIRDLSAADTFSQYCAACGRLDVSVRVLMYGQPYNSTTLEGCQPDPKAMNEKNFLMCQMCSGRVKLSNRVTHQKYLMYIECAKKVSEKRSTDPNKDTTCILNELLADEDWLNQLFYYVRSSWAEIDCMEYSLRIKNFSQ